MMLPGLLLALAVAPRRGAMAREATTQALSGTRQNRFGSR